MSKLPMEWFWQRLGQHLETKQLKQTKPRRLIIEWFLRLNCHISAEELYNHLRKEGHNIGLATVYRTLNMLKEAGLADQRWFTDGRSVFEVNRPGTHHDHLMCIKCETVVEFEDEIIENRQEELANQYGFKLVSHSHDLYGICSQCNRKSAKS